MANILIPVRFTGEFQSVGYGIALITNPFNLVMMQVEVTGKANRMQLWPTEGDACKVIEQLRTLMDFDNRPGPMCGENYGVGDCCYEQECPWWNNRCTYEGR